MHLSWSSAEACAVQRPSSGSMDRRTHIRRIAPRFWNGPTPVFVIASSAVVAERDDLVELRAELLHDADRVRVVEHLAAELALLVDRAIGCGCGCGCGSGRGSGSGSGSGLRGG